MAEVVISENSAAYVTVAFLDAAGTPAAPQTVTYTLHDGITGTLLLSTGVAPASSLTLTIPGPLNAIRHGQRYERRVLTVTSLDTAGQRQVDQVTWVVQNLFMVQSTST